MAIPPYFESLRLEAVASIAGIVALAFALYRWKAGKLDSKRDRERYLNERLEGRGWDEEPFTLSVSDILVDERSGLRYRTKRLPLRPLEGAVIVSLKSSHAIDDSLWDSELLDEFYNGLDVDVSYEGSASSGDTATILLRIESVELENIMSVIIQLTKWLQLLEQEEIINQEIQFG